MTKVMKSSASADKNQSELVKRLKTFAWSVLWVAIAAVADHTLSSLGMLHLPSVQVLGTPVDLAIIAGLVLNQISKYARNMRLKSEA